MSVTINGTTGIVTPTGTGDVSVGDDLTFTGTGNRITGDFSTATLANRVMFQTSTVNGNTIIGALPNETSTISRFIVNNNSDPTNCSYGSLDARADAVQLISAVSGTGTYLPMTFTVGAGGERVRIDTAGNVGIGTSSPASFSAKLVVNNGTNKNTTVRGAIRLSGSAIQSIQDNAATDSPLEIYTGAAQQQYEAGFFTWLEAGVEKMRIDSSGKLLVGTTSTFATGGATITSVANAGLAYGLNIKNLSSTNTVFVVFTNSSNGSAGNITQTGATTVAYATSSDYRLKENVQPMQGALEKVAQLKPCTYTWKADGSHGQGFIAHELQAVVPDAVTGEKDAVDKDGKPVMQGVDTSFLVATLTAALQEQQTIIQDLKARIEVLEQA